MILAARTMASPGAIWLICAVAVVCLAFWLYMVMVVATRPSVRHRRMPHMQGAVLGGMHLAEGGRSVAPNRELPALLPDLVQTETGQRVPAQRVPGLPEPARAAGAGPIPAQRTADAGTTAQAGTAADPADTADEAPTEPIPAQRAPDAGTTAATTADTGSAGRQ